MANHNTTASLPPTSLKHHIHYHYHYHNQNSSHSNNKHHQNELIGSSSLIIAIISIGIIILLLAIILLIIMLRRLQFSKKNYNNATSVGHTTISINASPAEVSGGGCLNGRNHAVANANKLRKGVQVFTFKEVEVATNGFSEANVIGGGARGRVYRGLLPDGTVAAFKVLQGHGRHGERAFRSQVDLLSRLRSPYITELLGYCADQHHRILVFEHISNGSLQKHLHHRHHQNQMLNWAVRLKIALHCAKALEYIHEYSVPTVIHRNLKCTNILLDQNFRPKLCGFGLAKFGSDKLHGLISTRVLGTTGYMAPEYASTGKLTTKSDVYSYGVILLELLTGRAPIDTTRPPGEHILVSWALPHLTNREKVVGMLDPALEGQYNKKDIIQVAAIAAMCVQTEADYRPLMTDVVQSMIPLVKNLPVLGPIPTPKRVNLRSSSG